MKTNANQQNPIVSVVMPVYNAEAYLIEALHSILGQSFANFELIAINDGSTDNSADILAGYSAKDHRLVVINQPNRGLVATLNYGIDTARGKYIARMDADDISFPDRFRRQVEILETHDNVVLVTGAFEIIDEEGEFLYREIVPAHDADIKRSMLLRNPIAHGSAMFRRDSAVQAGKYSDKHGPTEDYDLWVRLSNLGEFMALDYAVYRWRVNRLGITSTKNKIQSDIMKGHINNLWASAPPTVLHAKSLRASGRDYYTHYDKHGITMKNIMLADNARIAVKLIRRGHLLKGLQQLLAVLIVGRSGVKAVWRRFGAIAHGTTQALRRYAKYGRQEV
jgi:glycosyltransferase involved in cell wall biosynthesis